jgi:hypothetical protein
MAVDPKESQPPSYELYMDIFASIPKDSQPPSYELYMDIFELTQLPPPDAIEDKSFVLPSQHEDASDTTIEPAPSPPFDYTFLFDPTWWINWIPVLQLENK